MAKPDKHSPWLPAPYELSDVSALQALSEGKAGEHEQKRALKWIIEVASGTYQPSFRGGDSNEVAFNEGRRYVGLQIVKMLKLIVSNLRRNDELT